MGLSDVDEPEGSFSGELGEESVHVRSEPAEWRSAVGPGNDNQRQKGVAIYARQEPRGRAVQIEQ